MCVTETNVRGKWLYDAERVQERIRAGKERIKAVQILQSNQGTLRFLGVLLTRDEYCFLLNLLSRTEEELEESKKDTMEDKSVDSMGDLLQCCAEYDSSLDIVESIISKLELSPVRQLV